jgi:hypothetical protein
LAEPSPELAGSAAEAGSVAVDFERRADFSLPFLTC